MKHQIVAVAAMLLLTACGPSGSAIYERNRLAAIAVVQADVNAQDMTRYVILNETDRLNKANDATNTRYLALLSVARSPEEGAALMGEYTLGLEANRQRFIGDVEEALKMAERQRLVGRAVEAVNEMADSEAAIARRTFDLFVENELPRIMEEAASAIKEIEAHRERQRIEEEIRRAQQEADRKALEEEIEEPPVEQPPATTTPTPVPETE